MSVLLWMPSFDIACQSFIDAIIDVEKRLFSNDVTIVIHKAAGCYKSELELASLYVKHLPDHIVCAGKLKGNRMCNSAILLSHQSRDQSVTSAISFKDPRFEMELYIINENKETHNIINWSLTKDMKN